jgi:hypothetical protein
MFDELEPYSDYVPIPEIFHSIQHSGLFTKCIDCEKQLLEDDTTYLIEKAIKRNEVIFEYAICLDCATKLHGELSMESMQKIQEYFEKNVDMEQRFFDYEDMDKSDTSPWIDTCLVKNTPIDKCEEYQLYAMCSGDKMVVNVLPYMVSHAAIEDLQDLISKKTKDRMDDFIDDFMRIPPELKDIFKDLIII